jgi:hypothetical protein
MHGNQIVTGSRPDCLEQVSVPAGFIDEHIAHLPSPGQRRQLHHGSLPPRTSLLRQQAETRLPLQTKLEVGSVGSPLEAEADRMAAHEMANVQARMRLRWQR